ncbi:MAG: mycothiol synthase [Haloechinothrix sp.]
MVWVHELSPEQVDAVRALLLAARARDGRPEVDAKGPLPSEFAAGPHLLGSVDDTLVGYGHLDEAGDVFGRQVAELIVHPGHRGNGHGSALFGEITERASGTMRAWSHGDHPAAAIIAQRAGLIRVRELLRMHADLTGVPLDQPALPPGVRIRTFQPGIDERAVIEVNARAFSWHPEQGAMTVDDLLAGEREDWFEPGGFFLAHSGRRVLGFHWTKVHPPAPDPTADPFGGEQVGEVYVVGVDPDVHGGGVGTALTVVGLAHLRALGLRHVVLYVEGDNAPAVAVYSRLGFRTQATDVQYERS